MIPVRLWWCLVLGAWVPYVMHTYLVGNAVKITNFNVPSSYVIEDEENPDTLILDCAYEIEPNEKGIVLKWHLNGTMIYQWIPDSPPVHAFVSIPIASESRFNLMLFFLLFSFIFFHLPVCSCVRKMSRTHKSICIFKQVALHSTVTHTHIHTHISINCARSRCTVRIFDLILKYGNFFFSFLFATFFPHWQCCFFHSTN